MEEKEGIAVVFSEVDADTKHHQVIVIGSGMAGKAVLLASLIEKHGGDVEMITEDEAEKRGLSIDHFKPVCEMIIKAPPIIPMKAVNAMPFQSNREHRNDRRMREKNANRKHRY